MQIEEKIEKETIKIETCSLHSKKGTFFTCMDRRPGAFFPIVLVAFCQAPPSMKIPGDLGSKVNLPSVEWVWMFLELHNVSKNRPLLGLLTKKVTDIQ